MNKCDGLENEPDLLEMGEEEIRALLGVRHLFDFCNVIYFLCSFMDLKLMVQLFEVFLVLIVFVFYF